MIIRVAVEDEDWAKFAGGVRLDGGAMAGLTFQLGLHIARALPAIAILGAQRRRRWPWCCGRNGSAARMLKEGGD